jgi:hypothetical protein
MLSIANGVGFGYAINIVHGEDTTLEILSNQCTNAAAPIRTVSRASQKIKFRSVTAGKTQI